MLPPDRMDDKMTQNYQRLNIYITSVRKNNNLTDNQAQMQVIGELNRILSNCLGLEISDEGDILSGKGTLFFRKNDQSSEFKFDVLSSGEKEIVDILLDLYLKRGEFDDTIYLIDEPELHLNTGIQKKLLIEIEKIIPDSCQLWIATHSVGFLNALKGNLNDRCDIIYFEGDYSRQSKTLRPMIKSRVNWQKIFQTALEDLTGLIAPTRIVYCEGRIDPGDHGEDMGLDATVYNEVFTESEPDTLFVSSGGSTQPDKYASVALKVLGKAFNGVELLLLKDRDINGNGQITTDAQRKSFVEENIETNRMLIRREIENYLFDFEVVSKAFPHILKEDYDQIIIDIKDGNVKDSVGDLMALCNIRTGTNSVEFKKLLAKNLTRETSVYKELTKCVFNQNV